MNEEPLIRRGQIQVTPFALTVGALARARNTGVVEIRDSMGTHRAFFLNGTPQGARIGRLLHPLGQLVLQEARIDESAVNEALALHNRTDKLLGQVLLDMRVINEETLQRSLELQSRLNFLSLFALESGDFEFSEGLVHLTDFLPGSLSPMAALYQGVAKHGGTTLVGPLLCECAFAAVCIKPGHEDLATDLPAAERLALTLLQQHCFTGELARRLPMSGKSLGALLFALYQLDALEIAPALKVVL